ncbi:DUF1934 domain-containing protein [Defluviitalea phaphyphila]|uniref:DUF1934 domain-containing protein n=1 Tax=Defluviitalea phaphyphila TaxID=1473580 RepID=UPI00072FB466|nr:DUF1934 domain-containing protein [Defluviitalea phaphyphila]
MGTSKEKKVIVCVLGIQQYEEYENSIEMVASGKYYEKNGKKYITYKERLNSESEDTTTTIKIDGKQVSIIRFGSINFTMTFELNKKYTTYYDTIEGALLISVFTKHINIDLKDGEGKIDIVYSLEMNHVSMGINSFNIKIYTSNEGENIPLHKYNEESVHMNS